MSKDIEMTITVPESWVKWAEEIKEYIEEEIAKGRDFDKPTFRSIIEGAVGHGLLSLKYMCSGGHGGGCGGCQGSCSTE